jgi:hypothetical protein
MKSRRSGRWESEPVQQDEISKVARCRFTRSRGIGIFLGRRTTPWAYGCLSSKVVTDCAISSHFHIFTAETSHMQEDIVVIFHARAHANSFHSKFYISVPCRVSWNIWSSRKG